MKRQCRLCGTVLNRYHSGFLCYACQEKRAEERAEIYDEINYDLEAMAHILGLRSVESVKRLARKEKLPDRIPSIKKYLWRKKDVESWIEARHKLPPRTEEEDKAIILALKKGVPIEQITLYGHYPRGLLEWYREEMSRGHET